MGYDTIAFETRDHVGWITLNRPEAGNAISIQMAREIEQVSHRINQDQDIRAVVLTGSGAKAFCLGDDLDELSLTVERNPPSSSPVDAPAPHVSVPAMIASIECPVIAAINGDASGIGLALALACDLRIASDRAAFCVPDLSRGYFMSSGITQWLPRIVGRGKAMELMLTSDAIDAPEALRIGLVHRLAPPDAVLAEAEKLATQIASGAPLALRYVKEAVNNGMDLTLAQGLRLECDLYMILQTTRDRVEGITAFREKRPPHFTGE
jgi:enoyl-CoA hydratase/carnithine racemase